MAFFSYDILKSKYPKLHRFYYKIYDSIKIHLWQKKDDYSVYDIFLVCADYDKHRVEYLKHELEFMGYTVYLKQKDRILPQRKKKDIVDKIQKSKSMLFVTSQKYFISFEMPWEWHYFNSLGKKNLAILPLNIHMFSMYEMVTTWSNAGYKYISLSKMSKHIVNDISIMNKESYTHMLKCMDGKEMLFVHENSRKYVLYNAWIDGENPSCIDEKLYQMINYLDHCLK